MNLEQLMSEHYPDAVGITIKGPDVVLDSMIVDMAQIMQAKGYVVNGASRMVENERTIVFLNAGDAELARERLHESCRNSAGFLFEPKREVTP